MPNPFAVQTIAPAQELFRASGLTLTTSSDTVTAGTVNVVTGTALPMDISMVSNGLLVVNVGSATGTTPVLSVFFDAMDFFGNWALTSNATSINGSTITTGGTYAGAISNPGVLTRFGRIRWTITGTTPSFNAVSFSLYGR